jgi:hypothetical protein
MKECQYCKLKSCNNCRYIPLDPKQWENKEPEVYGNRWGGRYLEDHYDYTGLCDVGERPQRNFTGRDSCFTCQSCIGQLTVCKARNSKETYTVCKACFEHQDY